MHQSGTGLQLNYWLPICKMMLVLFFWFTVHRTDTTCFMVIKKKNNHTTQWTDADNHSSAVADDLISALKDLPFKFKFKFKTQI